MISVILNIILAIVLLLITSKVITAYQIRKRKAEKERIHKQVLIDNISYFIHQVEIAESLRELFVLHIKIWANGIRHKNFGPDQYGMFRTKDILMMVPEEVYLGNIWGLNTKPLPFWETQTPENQELVIKQYKTILVSNMNILKGNLVKEIYQ